MKLQIKSRYGQRDSRWANVILGYNTNSVYNLGGYGCLITSLGNYIGKTPQEINQILKDNGGFSANSGNFIWSKSTALGISQTYSSPVYTGLVTSQGIAKMQSLLDENRPLLTHVDFDPSDSDDDQHWLLVYGYEGETFFAFDPWSGTDITLGVYGGVKRAVIEFKAYDLFLPKEGEQAEEGLTDQQLKDLKTDSNNWKFLCRTYDINDPKQIVDKIKDYEDQIKTLRNEKEAIVVKCSGLQTQVSEKEKELLETRFKVAQWDNTMMAYHVQNFTELDAKIGAIGSGNYEGYMLIIEHDKSVKTLKEQLEFKYNLKEKTIKNSLQINELITLLINKVLRKKV